MGILLLLLFVAICFVLIITYAQRSVPLPSGVPAPAFALADQFGEILALPDGRSLVLAFFPRDKTSRCIGQIQEFATHIESFERLGYQVAFVAIADAESNKAFAEACHTNLPILADLSGAVSRNYGSIIDFGVFKFAKRSTFVIDANGTISRSFIVNEPIGHANAVLESLQQ